MTHFHGATRMDDHERIWSLEELRTSYRKRRTDELIAAGMDEFTAAVQVDEEVRQGAVLQAQPVKVVREGRAGWGRRA